MQISCPNCNHGIELVGQEAASELTCPTCGSEFCLLDDLDITVNVAERIPELKHFQLLHPVGSGRFGTVWKARDTRLNRMVAVKVPHNERLTRPEAEFFFREAQNAAQVSHPQIVTVYEVGRADNTVYIVSEYIDGVPLSDWRELHDPGARDVARICASVARALHAAHEKGIVHRDLKPGNIIMDSSGEPHLTDFGLAKRDTATTIAMDGQVLGTPAYMSPEQASGKGYQADARSDVFALGVILYELLTRQRPFLAHSDVLLEQIRHVDPKPPRSLDANISRDLETICLHAMEKSPTQRFQTAAEMADELQRYLDDQPISTRPVSLATRVGRWVGRRPALAAASVLAVFCASLLGVAIWLAGGGTGQVPPAARPVALETDPPGAEVAFIPLDAQSGIPWVSRSVRAGSSPVEVPLLPGDYLVVARLSDDHFHEVYRRVPGHHEQLPTRFPQSSWKMEREIVVLPPVRLFRQEDFKDHLAFVEGGPFQRLEQGGLDALPVAPDAIPSFLVDTREVTVADLRRANLPLPFKLEIAPPEDYPVTEVTWDEAIEYAERMGKRLLDEWEYEYLATAGGSRRFPWGNGDVPEGNWNAAPAGEPAHDVLVWSRAHGKVCGLFSNVAEWMDNWSEVSTLGRDQPIVRGGRPSTPNLPASPLLRTRRARPTTQSQIGFRCARSPRPRLKRADFVRAH